MSLDPQRTSLLPAAEKVTQWLFQGATPLPRPRQCTSPTRAPSGWSLSLSVSRAKRALEEEGRSHAAKAAKTDEGLVLKMKTEPARAEEVPETRVAATATPIPTVTLKKEPEDRLTRLEQQIASLRKANEELLGRLKDCDAVQEEAKENSRLEELNSVLAQQREKSKIDFVENYRLKESNLVLANELEKLKADLEEDKKLKESHVVLAQELEKSKTEIAALCMANMQLHTWFKDQEGAQEKEIKRLKELNCSLSKQLDTSKTETELAVQQWCDEVSTLKAKVENQKKNLHGLEVKLSKVAPHTALNFTATAEPTTCGPRGKECSSSECRNKRQELDALVARQRTRLTNQSAHLSHLAAALVREKQRSAAYTTALVIKQEPGGAAETQTFPACIKTEPESTVVLQPEATASLVQPARTSVNSCRDASVQEMSKPNPHDISILNLVTKAFPLAKCVIDNFEELSHSLPTLWPPVKAAIAAMPPATRTWCLGRVKTLGPPLPTETGPRTQLSQDKNHSSYAASTNSSGQVKPRSCTSLESVVSAHHQTNVAISYTVASLVDAGTQTTLAASETPVVVSVDAGTHTYVDVPETSVGSSIDAGTQTNVDVSETVAVSVDAGTQASVAVSETCTKTNETGFASSADVDTQTYVDISETAAFSVDASTQAKVDVSETCTQTTKTGVASSIDAGTQAYIDVSETCTQTNETGVASSIDAGTQAYIDVSETCTQTNETGVASAVDVDTQTNADVSKTVASSVDAGTQSNETSVASSVDGHTQTDVDVSETVASSADADTQTTLDVSKTAASTVDAFASMRAVSPQSHQTIAVREGSTLSTPAADRECASKLTPIVTEPYLTGESLNCEELVDVNEKFTFSTPVKRRTPVSTSMERESQVSTPTFLQFPLPVPMKHPVSLPTTPEPSFTVYGPSLPPTFSQPLLSEESPKRVGPLVIKFKTPMVKPRQTPTKTPTKAITVQEFIKESGVTAEITDEERPRVYGPQLPPLYYVGTTSVLLPEPEKSYCGERVVVNANLPEATKTCARIIQAAKNVHGGTAGGNDTEIQRGPAVYGPKLPPPASALPPPPFAVPLNLPLPPPAVNLLVDRTARPPEQASTKRSTSTSPATNVESGGYARKSKDSPSASADPKLAMMPRAVSLSPSGRPQAAMASSTAAAASCSASLTVTRAGAVPAAVGYPRYLYEGRKFDPRLVPVQPAATAAGVADEASLPFGPKLPPPASALPPPPFAFPVNLPPPPAAVPIDASCRGSARKRAAQDDGAAMATQASSLKRNSRISCDIEVLKKRIVQHLRLDGKR